MIDEVDYYLDMLMCIEDAYEPDIPSDEDLIAERMDEDRERRERERAERERVMGNVSKEIDSHGN